MRMLRACQRQHRKPVRKGRQVQFQFVGRPAGRDKVNFVEIKSTVCGPGYGQMSGMNGIKRSAKKCNSPGMEFCRCAVRLRCGQSASRICLGSILSRKPIRAALVIPRFRNHPGFPRHRNFLLSQLHLIPVPLFRPRVFPSESGRGHRPCCGPVP